MRSTYLLFLSRQMCAGLRSNHYGLLVFRCGFLQFGIQSELRPDSSGMPRCEDNLVKILLFVLLLLITALGLSEEFAEATTTGLGGRM